MRNTLLSQLVKTMEPNSESTHRSSSSHETPSSTSKLNTGLKSKQCSAHEEYLNELSLPTVETVTASSFTTPFKNVADRSDILVPSSNSASLKKDKDSVIQNAVENVETICLDPVQKKSEPLFYRRALMKEASTYELETFEKNILIIFYQIDIEGFKPRAGIDKDVNALENTFGKLGFTIKGPYDHCTKDEIFDKLKELTHRNNDLSEYGCVAVVILTYGCNDGFLRAKDKQYNEAEIINHFKFPENATLVTKPKVIMIQACREVELSSETEVNCLGNISRDADEPAKSYTLPKGSDILVIKNYYAGSEPHRLFEGSWFIQALCKKINIDASEKDLESIMTEVKIKVEPDNQPVTTSTLIRKLFLRKFGEGPPPMESFTDNKSRNELVTLKPVPSFNNLYCDFVKTCLKYYIEEKPDDETAKDLRDKATASEDDIGTIKEIAIFLIQNTQDCHCYKQISIDTS